VVQLVPDNIERTFAALSTLGYRPTVPIGSAQFANAALRESWIRDKGMQVLQFWCDTHIETPVDVFVTEPFSFDDEYERASVRPLHGSTPVRFVSIPTLIRMKEAAGRPQDSRTFSNCDYGVKMTPNDRQDMEQIDWSLTTWEGARREQLRRWAELPLERIIMALEEMEEINTQLMSR
jgi:hypothetical protein